MLVFSASAEGDADAGAVPATDGDLGTDFVGLGCSWCAGTVHENVAKAMRRTLKRDAC